MSDYTLTKDVDRKTGELPDRVKVCVPNSYAWVIVKELLMQLQDDRPVIEIEILGMLRVEK